MAIDFPGQIDMLHAAKLEYSEHMRVASSESSSQTSAESPENVAPTNPVTVNERLARSSMFAATVIVIKFATPAMGVLCAIFLVVSVGTTTLSGDAPPSIPRRDDAILVINELSICTTTPVASIDTSGDSWSVEGFLTGKDIAYFSPTRIVSPAQRRSVRDEVELFQCPIRPAPE